MYAGGILGRTLGSTLGSILGVHWGMHWGTLGSTMESALGSTLVSTVGVHWEKAGECTGEYAGEYTGSNWGNAWVYTGNCTGEYTGSTLEITLGVHWRLHWGYTGSTLEGMLGSTLEIALASSLRVHWGVHWEFIGEFASTITLFYCLTLVWRNVSGHFEPSEIHLAFQQCYLLITQTINQEVKSRVCSSLFFLSFFYIAILSALEQTHCTRMRDFTPFAHKLFSEIVLIFRPKHLFAVLLHPLLKRYLYKFYIIHPTIIYTAFTCFTPKLFTELLRPSLSIFTGL